MTRLPLFPVQFVCSCPSFSPLTRLKMLGKIIGQKYISIVKTWVPNLVVWGGVGGVALVHFTDWRLFLDYVPYINGKFKKDE